MIVDPDFMDHWRTGMVADLIGDQMAPVYILRLWAHCQERKSDRFVMPPRGLKAQCKFPGDADLFESALIESGFLERHEKELVVCGWAEKNASLIAAWKNGGKGGRPPKEEPKENPNKTQEEPKENPNKTQEEPKENPNKTQEEPIREEKRREESKHTDTDVSVVGSKLPDCPHEKILQLFAKHCPDLAQPRIWDGTRAKNLRARWRWLLTSKRKSGEPYATDEQSALEFFARFFDYVAKSDFLAGRKTDFSASLDWLVKAESFAKVLDGKYENTGGRS